MRSIDIDDKLDELIIRYKVDRFHPRFSKKRKAKQLLHSFLKNYEDDEKVIFVAGNLTDRNYFVEDSKKGIQKYEIVYYEQVTEYEWEKNRRMRCHYSIFLWKRKNNVISTFQRDNSNFNL